MDVLLCLLTTDALQYHVTDEMLDASDPDMPKSPVDGGISAGSASSLAPLFWTMRDFSNPSESEFILNYGHKCINTFNPLLVLNSLLVSYCCPQHTALPAHQHVP